MDSQRERFQIGEFAELVGLSIPQLRRCDRLQLLTPEGRSAAGYRYYSARQTGVGRVIALLRSMDMPIADIRRMLAGLEQAERQQLLQDHRARLEARLEEVRRLLDAVDRLTDQGDHAMNTRTDLTSWLHCMPRLQVSDVGRSVAYYQEALGFRLAWQTADGRLSALASGAVELLLLTPWDGDGPPPAQSVYAYVDDPDALCAEYEEAGATIVEAVGLRPHGMRELVVADPDGHRFTLGRADDAALRDAADQYGLAQDQIVTNPPWLASRAQT